MTHGAEPLRQPAHGDVTAASYSAMHPCAHLHGQQTATANGRLRKPLYRSEVNVRLNQTDKCRSAAEPRRSPSRRLVTCASGSRLIRPMSTLPSASGRRSPACLPHLRHALQIRAGSGRSVAAGRAKNEIVRIAGDRVVARPQSGQLLSPRPRRRMTPSRRRRFARSRIPNAAGLQAHFAIGPSAPMIQLTGPRRGRLNLEVHYS